VDNPSPFLAKSCRTKSLKRALHDGEGGRRKVSMLRASRVRRDNDSGGGSSLEAGFGFLTRGAGQAVGSLCDSTSLDAFDVEPATTASVTQEVRS